AWRLGAGGRGTFGRKRGGWTRPSGYARRRASIVCVVRRWKAVTSKNVPGAAASARGNSVTVSRCSSGERPSRSGQYSSKQALSGALGARRTRRPRTSESSLSTPGSSLRTVRPSGSVIRTGGGGGAGSGGSADRGTAAEDRAPSPGVFRLGAVL